MAKHGIIANRKKGFFGMKQSVFTLGVLFCCMLLHCNVMAEGCKERVIPAGNYCVNGTVEHGVYYTNTFSCDFGCYCVGANAKDGLSQLTTEYCARSNSGVNQSDSLYGVSGVYRCPNGKKSAPGAKSSADCYDVLTANDNSQNCKNPPESGHYCRRKNNTPVCEKGCYCPGGNINAVGGNGDNNPYGKVLSNCKNKNAWAKDYLNKRGIFYCPDGYTSGYGAQKITDCVDGNGHHYVVPESNNNSNNSNGFNPHQRPELHVALGGSCPAGSYMPTGCVPCTGNTVVNDAKNGCVACDNGKQPNNDHTMCVKDVNGSVTSNITVKAKTKVQQR